MKAHRDALHWLIVIAITLLCIGWQGNWEWMTKFPADWRVPFSDWLNVVMDWLIKYLGWFFRSIAWLLEWPI